MVWVKPSIGMGYYFRQRHELLLVGKRGALPTPDAEDRPDSVIEAASGTHSEKPEKVYELLERMYPLLDRVELFARQARPGWASWGNQVSL
jgi:N6-adenosine-specific RNA methylase IME4